MPQRLLTLGLIGCIGCAAGPQVSIGPNSSSEFAGVTGANHSSAVATNGLLESAPSDAPPTALQRYTSNENSSVKDSTTPAPNSVSGSTCAAAEPATKDSVAEQLSNNLSDGLRGEISRTENQQTVQPNLTLVDYLHSDQPHQETDHVALVRQIAPIVADSSSDSDQNRLGAEKIQLNLPSALAMVGGQHPVVGFARWRVQEAYAELAQAEALWLPSIQTGFNFNRHDGNLQASNGSIEDVNRNSFQYGLGAGAVGAGTTTRPGLVAQFHLADAIFLPRTAEKTAWARSHAATATLNRQLLAAALAYLELTRAHQDVSILEASKTQTAELAKITGDFAAAGQGLQADADRMQTELALMENRLIGGREQIAVASARLGQAISLDRYAEIIPMDVTVIPLELTSHNDNKSTFIATGLAMRPELKESQALVAAACEAYRREKFAPFVPSVLLGFSTGGFGGGLGNDLSDVDSRYDLDALMSWEVRNLGFGEKAARRAESARVEQAKFQRVQVMDQVAREISESYSRVQFRRSQIAATERAIGFAEGSYDLNLKRIRDGEGLPLEVLQSLQALETARRAYLRAVVDYNVAQLQLQWAQGWPVEAPAAM